ncbi:TonB-dependent receptor [bacterium]|nr:TonB-dependent receptor [bacterium]
MSKKAEKISKAPACVSVITGDQIERWGYRTLGEALRRIAGMYVSSDRNYDYLGVRGYSSPGDYNTRILLLIDGMRINDTMYDSATVGLDLPVDIKSIERIEVAKGPGSALWGTNALLGVVNIITKKARRKDEVRFTQSYGSDAENKSYLQYENTSPDGLNIIAAFSTLKSQGQKSIFFPEYVESGVCDGLARNVDGTNADHGYIAASYGQLKMTYCSGYMRKVIPTGSFGTTFNDDGNFTKDSRTHFDLSYETKMGASEQDTLQARVFYGDYLYEGEYVYDTDSDPLVNIDYNRCKWFGTELRSIINLNNQLSLTSGIEYTRTYSVQLDNYNLDPFLMLINSRGSLSVFSYYLQADKDISPTLKLVGGIRLDDYSTFGTHSSPRTAVIYQPTHSDTLKLLYGTAFRAPNFYEMDYCDGVTTIGNQNLQPENLTNVELVWEKALSNETRITTSFFNFKLDDVITQTINDDDMIQFVNNGCVRSRGIEVQADMLLPNKCSAYLGISLLKATDVQTDERITNSPRCIASTGISIPLVSDKLYLSPEAQYIGRRKTLAGNEIPSASVVNLTLKTNQKQDKTNFYLSIYNLLNRSIYVPGSGEHIQDQIPQEGRTIQFEASYRF